MRALPSQRLSQEVIRVWKIDALITTAVSLVIFGLIGAGLTKFSPLPLLVIWPICIGLVVACFIWEFLISPRLTYAQWRYEVTETEIDTHHGIFFVHRTIVPLVRVQYVRTSQGPIMRKFHLASVEIVTSGGDVTIPGLKVDEAEQLRDKVAVLARVAQEED